MYIIVGAQWIYESLSYCPGSKRSNSSLTSETRPLLHKPKAVTALTFAAPNGMSHIPNVDVSHRIQVSTAALQGRRWLKRKLCISLSARTLFRERCYVLGNIKLLAYQSSPPGVLSSSSNCIKLLGTRSERYVTSHRSRCHTCNTACCGRLERTMETS